MTVTNPLNLVTYVMFGLATVFIRLADASPPLPHLVLSGGLFRRIFLCSCLFLAALYLFVRMSLRYS
jgi:hypothetical protein